MTFVGQITVMIKDTSIKPALKDQCMFYLLTNVEKQLSFYYVDSVYSLAELEYSK